ncbi:hypothetical protein HDV03_001952 [Kappamyces sp. JEL0829]|nr:hypothetical protein HDV03_001952 [Kappamyces sp. JEL0829]
MLDKARQYPFKRLLCLDIERELEQGLSRQDAGQETESRSPPLYDVILCVGVLDFVADVAGMLGCFSRLLSPACFACVALTLPETANETLNHFNDLEMQAMIAQAGLKVVRQEKLLGYRDSETDIVTFYRGFLLAKL